MSRITFEQAQKQYGFYELISRFVQVLPLRTSKEVLIKQAAYPIQVSDFSYDPKAVNLTIANAVKGRLKLRGKKAGWSSVVYKNQSGKRAELLVLVVKRKEARLNTWFITHGKNAFGLKVPANNASLVSRLNKIYYAQAGVRLTPGKLINTSETSIPLLDQVAFDTSDQTPKQRKEIWSLLESAARGQGIFGQGNINVFFVKRWSAYDKSKTCKTGKCLTKDSAGTAGRRFGDSLTVLEQLKPERMFILLAHEVGHNLGAYHDPNGSNTLMDHFLAKNTTSLSIASVLEMHKLVSK